MLTCTSPFGCRCRSFFVLSTIQISMSTGWIPLSLCTLIDIRRSSLKHLDRACCDGNANTTCLCPNAVGVFQMARAAGREAERAQAFTHECTLSTLPVPGPDLEVGVSSWRLNRGIIFKRPRTQVGRFLLSQMVLYDMHFPHHSHTGILVLICLINEWETLLSSPYVDSDRCRIYEGLLCTTISGI